MEAMLVPGRLTLEALETWLAEPPVRLTLDPALWPGIEASAAVVARAALGEAAVYGVNTGFGQLVKRRIAPADVLQLQRRIVMSHMCGVGPPLADTTIRLVLLLKAASLALGRSGVRPAVIESLLAMLAADALPVVPSQGSVGASGDLAPLAHLAGAFLGLGEIRLAGELLCAREALSRLGREPLELGPKEGLALLNGTQVSTALAIEAWLQAMRLLDAAIVTGAMSVDAAAGSDVPFDPRLHVARGQPGQAEIAARLRTLLAGSAIRESHRTGDERVQDPYCLRCQPQVVGACLDLLLEGGAVLEREANGVSDNPLVFAETGEILSGGNFHAEPVALAADRIALALTEIGAIAERRIALLMDASLSGLPPFLVKEPGLNSGFMIAQVTAAALQAETKHLAHPVAIESLPTSANQEDHVSMATWAARRLHMMTANLARLIAIEAMAAAQGIELRRPLRTSEPLERAVAVVRGASAFLATDRPLGGEIEAVAELVLAGRLRVG